MTSHSMVYLSSSFFWFYEWRTPSCRVSLLKRKILLLNFSCLHPVLAPWLISPDLSLAGDDASRKRRCMYVCRSPVKSYTERETRLLSRQSYLVSLVSIESIQISFFDTPSVPKRTTSFSLQVIFPSSSPSFQGDGWFPVERRSRI